MLAPSQLWHLSTRLLTNIGQDMQLKPLDHAPPGSSSVAAGSTTLSSILQQLETGATEAGPKSAIKRKLVRGEGAEPGTTANSGASGVLLRQARSGSQPQPSREQSEKLLTMTQEVKHSRRRFIRLIGRFMWLLWVAVPLYMFALSLIIYFRRPYQSMSYLMFQVFIFIEGSIFIVCEQLAILAAFDH